MNGFEPQIFADVRRFTRITPSPNPDSGISRISGISVPLRQVRLGFGSFGTLTEITEIPESGFESAYTITERSIFSAFSKTMGPEGEALAEKFSKTLKQIKEDGTYQKIIDKHFK